MTKPLVWAQPSLKETMRSPPMSAEARKETGFLLRKLQEGHNIGFPHSRPMRNIGGGCHELRITDREQQWRLIYYIGDDAIYILEAFNKKAQKTPYNIIEVCKDRLSKINKG